MADRYEEPMATLGELAAHHRALIGQEPAKIEERIGRMSLRQMIVGYVELKAAKLAALLARQAEEKPLAAIAIGLGAGLIAGEMIRRAVFRGGRPVRRR